MRSKAASLRHRAGCYRLQGYPELADLLEAIATAHDQYKRSGVASLEEAFRWTPVVAMALKFTEDTD